MEFFHHEATGACCSHDASHAESITPTTINVAPTGSLSSHQEQAARDAAEKQRSRVAAAANVPPTVCANRPRSDTGYDWVTYGGPLMEEWLSHVSIVDARWFVDLAEAGGILPRSQEVPAEALITPESAWRLSFCYKPRHTVLPVLVVSYPWLDAHHPDRLGEQTRQIARVLRAFLEEYSVGASREHMHGEVPTIGVMMDYISLPQHPRTAAEETAFKRGLATMNSWYMHPFTPVLLVTTALPTGAAYQNTQPWARRGWCFFEKHASTIIKNRWCAWDLTKFDDACIDLKSMVNRIGRHGNRTPPLAPDEFGAMMQEGVNSGELKFTHKGDLRTVSELYRLGFVHAFDTWGRATGGRERYNLSNLGWGSAEAGVLTRALVYMVTHCTFTDGQIGFKLTGNGFSKEDEAALGAAVAGCVGVAWIKFS